MERMRYFDRITWHPNQMNDQACIRGMRLTVRRVVEAVALYPDRGDLFRNYPEFSRKTFGRHWRSPLPTSGACCGEPFMVHVLYKVHV